MISLKKALIVAGYIKSTSVCRRLLMQGAVKVNGVVVTNPLNVNLQLGNGDTVQIGNFRAIKIVEDSGITYVTYN